MQNPLILYYPHAYPPPILSHPIHALPLFYPTHACPPPILSRLMHTLPPYSVPAHAYPAHYSIPSHAYLPPILSQPMHTFPLFYPSPCIPCPLFYASPYIPSPILIYQGVHCCTKVCNLHLDDSPSKSRDNQMHWTRSNSLKWKGIYKNYEPFTDQLQPIYFTCNDL